MFLLMNTTLDVTTATTHLLHSHTDTIDPFIHAFDSHLPTMLRDVWCGAVRCDAVRWGCLHIRPNSRCSRSSCKGRKWGWCTGATRRRWRRSSWNTSRTHRRNEHMGHMSGKHVWIGRKKVWVDIYINVCMIMNHGTNTITTVNTKRCASNGTVVLSYTHTRRERRRRGQLS